MTARWITFSSSRTLPGQSCCISALIAASEISGTGRSSSAHTFLRKWNASAGMSSRRSRSAGAWIGNTATR